MTRITRPRWFGAIGHFKRRYLVLPKFEGRVQALVAMHTFLRERIPGVRPRVLSGLLGAQWSVFARRVRS